MDPAPTPSRDEAFSRELEAAGRRISFRHGFLAGVVATVLVLAIVFGGRPF